MQWKWSPVGLLVLPALVCGADDSSEVPAPMIYIGGVYYAPEPEPTPVPEPEQQVIVVGGTIYESAPAPSAEAPTMVVISGDIIPELTPEPSSDVQVVVLTPTVQAPQLLVVPAEATMPETVPSADRPKSNYELDKVTLLGALGYQERFGFDEGRTYFVDLSDEDGDMRVKTPGDMDLWRDLFDPIIDAAFEPDSQGRLSYGTIGYFRPRPFSAPAYGPIPGAGVDRRIFEPTVELNGKSYWRRGVTYESMHVPGWADLMDHFWIGPYDFIYDDEYGDLMEMNARTLAFEEQFEKIMAADDTAGMWFSIGVGFFALPVTASMAALTASEIAAGTAVTTMTGSVAVDQALVRGIISFVGAAGDPLSAVSSAVSPLVGGVIPDTGIPLFDNAINSAVTSALVRGELPSPASLLQGAAMGLITSGPSYLGIGGDANPSVTSDPDAQQVSDGASDSESGDEQTTSSEPTESAVPVDWTQVDDTSDIDHTPEVESTFDWDELVSLLDRDLSAMNPQQFDLDESMQRELQRRAVAAGVLNQAELNQFVFAGTGDSISTWRGYPSEPGLVPVTIVEELALGARTFKLFYEGVSAGIQALTNRFLSVPVINGERMLLYGPERAVSFELSLDTKVFRYEPIDVPTPMMAHPTIYERTGFEFKYNYLYLATEESLPALTQVRAAQGYFNGSTVLRESTLGEVLRAQGPGAMVIEDVVFNASLGTRQGIAVVVPRTVKVPASPN